MTAPADVLREAAKWIGTTESPPKSNHCPPFTDYMGLNGKWCAAFISYVFNAVGFPLHIVKLRGGYGFASCEDGLNYFKHQGQFFTTAQPGDIAFFDWNKADSDSVNHVGIVESVTNTHVITIDGNSRCGANAFDGGQVVRCKRTLASIRGFGRPVYDGLSSSSVATCTTSDSATTSIMPDVSTAGMSAVAACTANASNVRIVVNIAKQHGLTNDQIYGVLGNVYVESGFSNKSVGDNGHAFGLFQANTVVGIGIGKSIAQLQDPTYNTQLIFTQPGLKKAKTYTDTAGFAAAWDQYVEISDGKARPLRVAAALALKASPAVQKLVAGVAPTESDTPRTVLGPVVPAKVEPAQRAATVTITGSNVRVEVGNMVRITLGGQAWVVAEKYQANFKGFLEDAYAQKLTSHWSSSGGYNPRFIGDTQSISQHAYGYAIDIAGTFNQQGLDLPYEINAPLARSLAAKWGLVWGGDWTGERRDPMHFEIGLNPTAALTAQASQRAVFSSATVTQTQGKVQFPGQLHLPSLIVLTVAASDVVQAHRRGDYYENAHYVVSGSDVTAMADETSAVRRAGSLLGPESNWKTGANGQSLFVDIVGSRTDAWTTKEAKETLKTAAELVARLAVKYNIRVQHDVRAGIATRDEAASLYRFTYPDQGTFPFQTFLESVNTFTGLVVQEGGACAEPTVHPDYTLNRPLYLTIPVMTGDDVQRVQQIVGARQNGIFGIETQFRVYKWQIANSLPGTGIWGRDESHLANWATTF